MKKLVFTNIKNSIRDKMETNVFFYRSSPEEANSLRGNWPLRSSLDSERRPQVLHDGLASLSHLDHGRGTTVLSSQALALKGSFTILPMIVSE